MLGVSYTSKDEIAALTRKVRSGHTHHHPPSSTLAGSCPRSSDPVALT